ncbi:multidrug ABC transporter permease [Nanoarchaeota archaeon]
MINLDQIYWMWRRNVIKYLRDKMRFVSSLFQPILLLFVMGLGFSFIKVGNINYLSFLFPGIVGISVVGLSLMSGISLIWDKEFGVFKLFQVSPASRLSVFLGNALGGSTIGIIQGILVLLFSFIIHFEITPISFLLSLLVLFLISLGISSLGLLLGIIIDTFEGFGAISSFLIFPLMFLSGAFYPLNVVPKVLYYITLIDPLSYGIDLLRGITIGLHYLPLYIDILVLILFDVLFLFLGMFELNRKYQ